MANALGPWSSSPNGSATARASAPTGSNLGTRFENGIADVQAQLGEARAARNQAEVERLENELAQVIENAKPGKGPDDSWATADLDVNDDGVVDKRDLDAPELQVRPASSDEPAR
jgi:hypothetical protein